MAPDVLVVAGLGIWVDGQPKTGKIKAHVYPIADAADEVCFVCTGPTADRTSDITYHQVPQSRWKVITLLRQLVATLRVGSTGNYDQIVSFALIPYGLFALITGGLTRTPVHLGIIGSDLDVHARAWYGPVVDWLFRRFDSLSVAGQDYRERLRNCGVVSDRIFTVLHPVDEEFSRRTRDPEPHYDVLWLTRMSPEKSPLLAVETLAELADRGVDFSAALVGDGPLESEVRTAVQRAGLAEQVDVPGWTPEPVEYYRDTRTYFLTSEREMLPLTLVEAMFVGVPSVVPPVGAIPDIVDHNQTALLVEKRTSRHFADALEALLADDAFRERVARNAPSVQSRLSFEAVAASWTDIFEFATSADR